MTVPLRWKAHSTTKESALTRTLRIAMNGITGRMGYRQHLVRSILPIRDQGGVTLEDGTLVQVEPVLVGRNEARLREIAAEHGIEHISTDTDGCMTADDIDIYFDAQATSRRFTALSTAISAGKHIFTEKPTAETLEQAIELARLAKQAGIIDGVVHDKLYLPGLVKLRQLIDEGFFGRILSMRGEFGYWVWEGTDVPAQRPSWNYRAEDGGGMTTDMYPHWNYVIEGLLGQVKTVYSQTVTHIPERIDENGAPYKATADDAAYGIFQVTSPEGDDVLVQINSSWDVRVHRKRARRVPDRRHARLGRGRTPQLRDPGPRKDTPTPTWNPDLPDPNDYGSHVDRSPAPTAGERLQAAVGGVHPRRGMRPQAPVRPVVGRPWGAAGGAR
jgi:predicted dehydrogenase